MSFARKMFPGISEIIVGVKNWCNARFSLLGHTHAPNWGSKATVFSDQTSAYINSSSYGTQWTAPSNGFLYMYMHHDNTSGTVAVTMRINSTHEFLLLSEIVPDANVVPAITFPVGVNDVVDWKRSGNLGGACNCIFIPYS